MLRISAAILLLVTLSGCAIPLRNGEDAPALGRKTVTRKIMPDTLVAFDDTRCATTQGKFTKTQLKTEAWCIWLVPSRTRMAGTP